VVKPRPFYLVAEDPPAKQAILRAAMRLFIEKGLSATSIRDLSEVTGFTNPALYRHFESKEALARYLFEASYLRIHVELAEAAAVGGTAARRLDAYVTGLIGLLETCPEAVLLVNDHLRELWRGSAARLLPYSHVAQARALVDAVRPPRSVAGHRANELAVAALLGTGAQLARLFYFGHLQGRPRDWKAELTALARNVVRAR
jgi:AcrR family transcriptional regulator